MRTPSCVSGLRHSPYRECPKTFHRRNSGMMCVPWLWSHLEDSFKGLGYRTVDESACLACSKLWVQFPALHTLGEYMPVVLSPWNVETRGTRVESHPQPHSELEAVLFISPCVKTKPNQIKTLSAESLGVAGQIVLWLYFILNLPGRFGIWENEKTLQKSV